MNALLMYLFLTIVLTGMVMLGYLTALRSGRFFRLNRIYLLTGLLISFTLPLAGLNGWLPGISSRTMAPISTSVHHWLQAISTRPINETAESYPTQEETTISVTAPATTETKTATEAETETATEMSAVNASHPGYHTGLLPAPYPVAPPAAAKNRPSSEGSSGKIQVTVPDILFALYLLVFLALLLRFSIRLLGMRNLRRKAETCTFEGHSVCWVPDEVPPFSFFRTIFLSRSLQTDQQLKEIVRHEAVHIREGHSFDILLLQSLKVLFWFNPFLYLMDRSLRESHEFLADAKVLAEGLDIAAYEQLLLRHLGGGEPLVFSSHFNYSIIKRRLNMFSGQKNRNSLYKPLIMIPVIVASMLVCSAGGSAFKTSGSIHSDNTSQSIADNTAPSEEAPAAHQGIRVTESGNQSLAPDSEAGTPPHTQSSGLPGIDQEPYYPGSLIHDAPCFPGGQPALQEFFMNHLYPSEAYQNNKELGRVIVSFIVESDGKILNPKIIQSLSPACDAQVIKAIEMMPRWIPATNRYREKIRAEYTLPILPPFEQISMQRERFIYGTSNGRIYMIQAAPGSILSRTRLQFVKENQSGRIPSWASGGDENPKDTTFTAPLYPGSLKDLRRFFDENTNPLVGANVCGSVMVQFVVETDGSITRPKVVLSLGPECDAEAIRLIKLMPKCIPAKKNSVPVAATEFISILFGSVSPHRVGIDSVMTYNSLGKPVTTILESNVNPDLTDSEIIHTRENGYGYGPLKYPRILENGFSQQDFITTNLTYPEPARDEGARGIVVVSFWLEENGKITRSRIDERTRITDASGKSVSARVRQAIENEALQIVRKLPVFTPVMYNGNPVRAHILYPIVFHP